MKNKKNNEELQSRREFFKQAAKGALPIIAATVLASAPAIMYAAEPTMGCTSSCESACVSTCYTGCTGGCAGACTDHCAYSCSESCHTTCENGVKN